MPKAAEFPIEGKEGGRIGEGGFDENKGSRPLPSFVGILQLLGSFYSANLRSSLSYSRGVPPTPEAISNGSIVCCRSRIPGRKQTGRRTFTTVQYVQRYGDGKEKRDLNRFPSKKNLIRSHGQRQKIYLRNFGTFYVPERRGKGAAPFFCQKYSFPLRYFAALPSFFWTREGSVDNSPFPPSLLSFFSAREGLFSHNIVCQNKEQRFPPLFPPAASSSPCNGQYLPKLKGKMAIGRKMTREIPLPPPEGKEGERKRWMD